MFQKVKNSLVQERERLYNLLKEVPYLKPHPSYANFILCEVISGKDAKKLKVNYLLDNLYWKVEKQTKNLFLWTMQ